MSTQATTDLMLWETLERELTSMLDTFGHLIRASQVPVEEGEAAAGPGSKDRKAPGDILEVRCCCCMEGC